MRRVLHVMTVPMSLGFLRGQAAFMRQRGFELGVTCAEGTGLHDFAKGEGVWCQPFPIRRSISPVADVLALRKLRAIIDDWSPDIVHGHSPKGGLLAMIAAASCGVPRIYHLRGLPLATARGTAGVLLRGAEMTTCGLAHRVISVSDSLRREVVQQRIVPGAKVRVLGHGSGNGVDCERFMPATGDSRQAARASLGISTTALVFMFAGRFTRDKGIEELLSAWESVGPQVDRALVLVGEQDSRQPLPPAQAARLGGQPNVHVVPFTPLIERFYAAADVVVLPTYREGFPNVALEAAACGLPIVASRVTGCVDAVRDGETGTLVEPRSAAALATAMTAYASTELRLLHGTAARNRVERLFRPELIHEELAREYDLLPKRVLRKRSNGSMDSLS